MDASAPQRRAGLRLLRRALLAAVAIPFVMLESAPVALAQAAVPASGAPAAPPAGTPAPPPADERQIIVIGNRAIVATLEDAKPEQTYTEDDVASYDVSTVGELLSAIRGENGDRDPAVLVNGQPIADLGDINDLPAEAIARVEQLPRGSAQRVGGAAGQRAYNIVLRPSVRTAVVTLSRETATEGDWGNSRGELLLTYVRDQDRFNATFRAADSNKLFEADRDLSPRIEPIAFAPDGNVLPFASAEVDPGLSALAGRPVTVVALPQGNARPTLAALLPGANQVNPSEQARYRTLRAANRPYEVAIAGNKTLTDSLQLAINGRLSWTETESNSGLPSARFTIPASNPFTPFSTAAFLAVSDRSRPLTSTGKNDAQSFSATLNGNFGSWHSTLAAKYDSRGRDNVSQFTGPLAGGIGTIDAATNPFAGTIASRIPVSSRTTHSRNTTAQAVFDAQGPLAMLWAGPLVARVNASAARVSLDATSSSSADTTFRRHEYLAKGGLTLPLTSAAAAFFPALGDSEVAFDIGWLDLGRFGTLNRHSFAFNWAPAAWLNLSASEERQQQSIGAELLASPEVITPNVPYFDPLTSQTVDVTTIYGGAAGLLPEDLRTRTFSLAANPLEKYGLRLTADYVVTDLDNQIGALPPPSSAVVAAFPDRYVRDASGTLVLVDNRSVNFSRQHTRELRLGAGVSIPLVEAIVIPANRDTGEARRRIPPVTLQVNGSHTFVLESTTVIRPGLPEIDMLGGGAIGIGGGRPRHSTDINVVLSRGGTGVRAAYRQRGLSLLTIGSAASPDQLTFGTLTTFDLRAFADLGQLFPSQAMAKNTRVTVAFDNLFNDRQRVRDRLGATPQAYQPAYRDPIGRTIMIELRKLF